MSRMNAPWANPEQFGDAMPEFLRSPMTVAVGASVLAHGIFFLGLPVVMTHDNHEDIRPVNVVQLTPQEQASLPATSLQQPLSSNLLPSTLSPNGLLTPSFPSSPSPTSSPMPFDFSGLPSGSTSVPNYSFPSNDSDNTYTQNRIRDAEAREAEARSALEKERLKTTVKPTPTPAVSTPATPATPASITPLPPVSPSPGASPSSAPPTNPPIPQTTPTPTQTQNPVVVASVNPFHAKKAQEIPNGLVYNAENTQSVPIQGTSSQWYSAKVLNNPILQRQGDKQVMASAFAKQIDALMLKSPRKTEEITSYDPKQPILIGFVLAPNGQILENTIDVARSSGYPELNAIAVGEIRDRLRRKRFAQTPSGKYEIYTIGVTFVP